MEKLGYTRFALQGGDIGAGVSVWTARLFPERVVGVHLNFIPGGYRPQLQTSFHLSHRKSKHTWITSLTGVQQKAPMSICMAQNHRRCPMR